MPGASKRRNGRKGTPIDCPAIPKLVCIDRSPITAPPVTQEELEGFWRLYRLAHIATAKAYEAAHMIQRRVDEGAAIESGRFKWDEEERMVKL